LIYVPSWIIDGEVDFIEPWIVQQRPSFSVVEIETLCKGATTHLHVNILAKYGINCELPFPEKTEYSKPQEELVTDKNDILIVGNSAIGRAVAEIYTQRGHYVQMCGRTLAQRFDLYDRETWPLLDNPENVVGRKTSEINHVPSGRI
jgi:hypothetical protein